VKEFNSFQASRLRQRTDEAGSEVSNSGKRSSSKIVETGSAVTKALIVYGTRYGATASTSEEIAETLRREGMEVRVVNAKKESVKDIAGYDLIIVGSGIRINRWTSEPEKFLQQFHTELMNKKVALFVSSGGQAIAEHEGNQEKIAQGKRKYLDEKVAKYNLKPIALGLFGGIWDFNKWPWWAGKAIPSAKQALQSAGFMETKPGVYDTRDWNAIQSWAKSLVQ
jgi:menaquinone-dependent protoporphyrinogen oxidase